MEENIKLEKVFGGEFNLQQSEKYVRTSDALFFPRENFIVSGHQDGTIRFWDLNCKKGIFVKTPLKSIQVHNYDVQLLMKWDDRLFVSCGQDNNVNLINVDTMEKVKLICHVESTVTRTSNNFKGILKLDNDHILLISYGYKTLLEISYSQSRITRHLKRRGVHSFSALVLSTKYPDHFYLSCNKLEDGIHIFHQTIVLIDWKRDENIRFFPQSNLINTISLYRNKNDDEMIVAGGSGKVIFVYNSRTEELVRMVEFGSELYCSFIFQKREKLLLFTDIYVLLNDTDNNKGATDGYAIIDLKKALEGKQKQLEELDYIVCKKFIHTQSLLNIKMISYDEIGSEMKIVTTSFDGRVIVSKIDNIIKNDIGRLDLLERIGYLLENNVEDCFSVEIRGGSFDGLFLYKSLFLL